MAERYLQQGQDLQPLSSRLGYLGLIPFVSLAAAAVLAPASLRGLASDALLAYGATILSFLGGIYWGLAIASPAAPSARLLLFLGVGVTPQLLGWAALLLPGEVGFFLTATGLLALLIADRAAVKYGMAPRWFLRLRWPLSTAAAVALLVGGFSSGL
jgi:xanthosine utilization system XapX-like protein